MDALLPELTRRFDPSKPIGYLNFSDGRPDPRFRALLADATGFVLESNDPTPWATLRRWLLAACDDLERSGSAAFKDVTQAREVLALALEAVPAAYRKHHADLLAHQPDAALLTPFFLARCCEVALTEWAAGTNDPAKCVAALNDFVGYRPIAVLETRPQTDFYTHEKVCPLAVYFRGVGVGPGPYHDVVRLALELLQKTDADLLDEACFDFEKMDELAVDPRATDHFHPVNKRPNVLFGEWDPHKIDGRGFYRRFVVRQGTLDALVRWSVAGPASTTGTAIARERPQSLSHPDHLFEASAVLAGTILMGAGICGTGPTYYDSSVTLSKLVQKIARFRDRFYQQLLDGLPGEHGERLRAEAKKLKQPFGGVRQALNGAIASERALHLQERRLAVLFAAMGYATAARERAAAIPAPAARMTAEIRLRQTAAQYAIRNDKVADTPGLLAEAEDLLRRGIDCGALIDPWNILGFQGLFPTFSDRGDTVRDPRAEELILTVGRQLDVYAAALSAASAAGEGATAEQLRKRMHDLAGWWDKFATSTVSELPKVIGADRADAGEHVAESLALWKTGGATDPAFWRKHRDGFHTPAAYAQVVDALIDHGDHRAAMALLVAWLSEADTVPLQDPSASFFRLAFRWLKAVVSGEGVATADRGPLVRRFFEMLEVNADDRWRVPAILTARPKDDDEDEEDDWKSGLYADREYKDSTDDGVDSSLADDAPPPVTGDFPLDGEAEPTTARLRFLAAVARLWRLAARPDLFPANEPDAAAVVAGWVRNARENLSELVTLTEQVHAVVVPEPVGGVEGVSEYDRRRSVKAQLLDAAVQTAVETAAAARALAAMTPNLQELPGGEKSLGPTAGIRVWETAAVRLERAVASAQPETVRQQLAHFIKLFRHEPMLVCPPSEGGAPGPAIRAQTAQQMMESLLARLPRLGLLRETFHLTKLARQMERNDIPEGRRVSSFDVPFRTAVAGTVDAILTAARGWGEGASEDGPLAAALKQISESYQKLWLEHSQTLRLSSLEGVLDQSEWNDLKAFIKAYGSDLFTVRFLTTSNVRGVLGQGAAEWLDREVVQGDADPRPKLVEAWANGTLDKGRAARHFETVLSALLEHYDEYRDYNTTTTQSDYGENLYILLDFLRLKVAYDRYAWRLRPLVLAHDVLCKRGYDRLASKWREFVGERTHRLADELLTDLAAREAEHGMKLRTVRDRLEERFVQPLRVDQACARVPRAAAARRDGQPEDNPAFRGLLAAIRPLAESPVGVGLDIPAWVRRLEDELRKVKLMDPDEETDETSPAGNDEYPLPPHATLDLDDFRRQVREWDSPLGD
ncbi:MAG: hypothetical protein MUF18_11050 [Fimbriiglobus sp.]|jgi:hypothetical protein|nr:hypothetical protein [Fimbriiglobus sp.]